LVVFDLSDPDSKPGELNVEEWVVARDPIESMEVSPLLPEGQDVLFLIGLVIKRGFDILHEYP
jgi:hypothetical protein